MSGPVNEVFEAPLPQAEEALETTVLPPRHDATPLLRRWRLLLMAVPVLLVLLGVLLVYATGGRWVQTENAYIKADKAQISAQVSGPLSAIYVRTNQAIKAGDVLFAIDDKTYAATLAAALAARDQAIGQINSGKASYRQKLKERDLARKNLAFAARELKRRQKLVSAKVVSAAKLDAYQHEYDIAVDRLAAKRQDISAVLAQLGDPDAPAEHHPLVREAIARADAAALDLEHTRVRAPIGGIAAHVPVRGNYVNAGQPVMALVADKGLWVEANFKETQLAHVRPGQPVLLRVDTYPQRQWQGRVRSINPASGAEFALLPPQNASGNWVKVVQRIPVRITIEAQKNAPPLRAGMPPLRAGMSVRVRIDTGHHRAMPGLVRAPLRWLGADVG